MLVPALSMALVVFSIVYLVEELPWTLRIPKFLWFLLQIALCFGLTLAILGTSQWRVGVIAPGVLWFLVPLHKLLFLAVDLVFYLLKEEIVKIRNTPRSN